MACSFLLAGMSFARDPQNLPESSAPYRGELKTLAARVLKIADKAKCHPNSCTVLVANFTTPSGSTSRLGIQLADSISAELIAQGNGIRTVDRSLLHEYLVRQHIPSNTLKDREAARWLATEFKANAVLLGKIEQLGDRFNLLTELVNISSDKVGPQEAMWIAISEPLEAFAPFEPYDAEHSGEKTDPRRGSVPVLAGARAASHPTCIHCSPPEYTNAARKAKFMGTVVLEVTVTEEGRAADISVLRGVPFGLSGAAIKAVSGWSFKPATDKEGKAVAVIVPIEVSFRLY